MTTKYMSGCKYPTISAVVPRYKVMMQKLENYICRSNALKATAKNSWLKLKKYYTRTDLSPICSVATSKFNLVHIGVLYL